MTHSHFLSAPLARSAAIVAIFLAVILVGTAVAMPTEPTIRADDPTPSPELEPSDVVRVQVEALRKNGTSNGGIGLTYRFASPGNKRNTGPLARFTRMVRSAPYDRLLNHISAEYSPVAVSGNAARQMVLIVDAQGDQIVFVWMLSRQTEGAFKGCWMTDAVIPAESPAQRTHT